MMVVAQLMNKKYIIQVENGQPFPFEGTKPSSFQHFVRNTIAFNNPQQSTKIAKDIYLLEQIRSSILVQIVEVVEIRGAKCTIDYEYVPESLKHTSKINDSSFVAELKCKIYEFFKLLSQMKINFFPNIDNIGLTADGEPKIYIPLPLEISAEDSQQNLLVKYQSWNENLFNIIHNLKESSVAHSEHTFISEYSQKLNKKINQIEQKLTSIKGRKLSESSKFKQARNAKRNNMVLQYIPNKKIRYNSFAQGLAMQEQSQKMSQPCNSSMEDQITNSKKSSKDESLKRRLNDALEKTQSAFKLYEKYRRKSRR